MFHNYFFLKRLANELDFVLKEFEFLECFSQNKDELILGFSNKDESLYIRANLDPQISLLHVSDDFRRAKKNSVDLFRQLIGKAVTSVATFSYERSFAIHFDNDHQLIFKMHGSRSNILLADHNSVVSVFRNSLPNDLNIIPNDLNQAPEISKARFFDLNGNFQKFIPALGKEVKIYLQDRNYEKLKLEEKWSLVDQTLTNLNQNPIWIYNHNNAPQLSLLKLPLPILLETISAIEACAKYYEIYTRIHYLSSEKSKGRRTLEDRIRKTENYLSKTQEKLDSVKNQRKYDEIANILMANLHQIPKGQSKVTLTDFYTETPITIKLNPQLTPQKNAENLYRKAKNQQIEISKLEENLKQREEQLFEMLESLSELEKTEDVRTVRKMLPKEIAKSIDEQPRPYHQHEFNGYTILVGKNARYNDELTLKVANKEDLWLHAKDVAGSHVVVRHQAGKKFPKDVLEKAAELAAWFSKRKTDSLCPVIYTPKKFVRKRKGSPPGAVVVEKEEIIMVVPTKDI